MVMQNNLVYIKYIVIHDTHVTGIVCLILHSAFLCFEFVCFRVMYTNNKERCVYIYIPPPFMLFNITYTY